VTKDIFAVVVLRHNNFDKVIKALDSIYNEGSHDLLIILVDNGSSDGKLPDIKNRYDNLEVVISHDNLLYCSAYNIGIERALSMGAKYINIAHDDSYDYSSNYFDIVRDVFESDPLVGLVGSKCLGLSGKVAWGGENHKKLGVDMNTPTCGYTISKDAFNKIGLLDEKLGVYFEDLDFIQRLRDKGLITNYIDSISFTHMGSDVDDAANRHLGWRCHYYRVRNLFWFMKKHKKHMSSRLVFYSIKRILPFHFSTIRRVVFDLDFKNFVIITSCVITGLFVGLFFPYVDSSKKHKSHQKA
jgi:GT2 family glycosyltransferase